MRSPEEAADSQQEVFDPEITLAPLQTPEPGDVRGWGEFERNSLYREEAARQLVPLIGRLAAEGPDPEALTNDEYWQIYGPSRAMGGRVSDMVFETMQQRGRAHVAHLEKLKEVGPAGITPQLRMAGEYEANLAALEHERNRVAAHLSAAEVRLNASRLPGHSLAEQNYWDGVVRLYQEEAHRLQLASARAIGDRNEAITREWRAQQAAAAAAQAQARPTFAPRPGYAPNVASRPQPQPTYLDAFRLQQARLYGHAPSDPMTDLTSGQVWGGMGFRERAIFLYKLGYSGDEAAAIMRTGPHAPDDPDGIHAREL